jgi:pyrroloquinoline quinone biosynthesis protein B
LASRIDGADVLLFDGTTFSDDELVTLGLSTKSAARMGHLAISGSAGSMSALSGLRVGRKIYIHLNNTNPVLIEGGAERALVEAQGWEVAFDGMIIDFEGERLASS